MICAAQELIRCIGSLSRENSWLEIQTVIKQRIEIQQTLRAWTIQRNSKDILCEASFTKAFELLLQRPIPFDLIVFYKTVNYDRLFRSSKTIHMFVVCVHKCTHSGDQ